MCLHYANSRSGINPNRGFFVDDGEVLSSVDEPGFPFPESVRDGGIEDVTTVGTWAVIVPPIPAEATALVSVASSFSGEEALS